MLFNHSTIIFDLKKFFTSFILLLFLFNIFGFYIPYLVKRTVIRSEMNRLLEESLPGNLIVKLSFDLNAEKDSPAWVREGKEFRYNDEMYDVLKSEIHNGKVTYYCVRDRDEKELESSFEKLLKKNQDNEGKSRNMAQKELSKYFPVAKIVIPSVQKANNFNICVISFYKSLNKEILSPPPEVS